MYLVKFTDAIYKKKAINGESIRIGSVLHYRSIDDKRFRDEDEGQGRMAYKSEVPLDAETHNRIFEHEGFKLADGWTINMAGVPLLSERSPFNPFVFSCSLVRRKADIPKLARVFKKKHWYFINDPWKFIRSISPKIREKVRSLRDEFDMGAEAELKFDKLEAHPVMGKITYTNESKDITINEREAPDYNPRSVMIRQYFQKTKRFEDEQEFRFLWLLNLGSIQDNDIDLCSLDLKTMDLKCDDSGIANKGRSIKEILDRNGNRIA